MLIVNSVESSAITAELELSLFPILRSRRPLPGATLPARIKRHMI